jgi:hypothetical protein
LFLFFFLFFFFFFSATSAASSGWAGLSSSPVAAAGVWSSYFLSPLFSISFGSSASPDSSFGAV